MSFATIRFALGSKSFCLSSRSSPRRISFSAFSIGFKDSFFFVFAMELSSLPSDASYFDWAVDFFAA
jgi:hypothetical protein